MKDSFAALAPAVQEGQRIVNGMQDILKLFLTRILTMALLIVSSLVIGVFPFALRHGSLITLFSVGIPTVLLAVWARPGPTPKGTLVQRLAKFVLTPVLMTSAFGLLVFYAGQLLPLSPLVTGTPLTPVQAVELLQATRPIAQTTLTAFLVLTGLLLVIFVEPPIEWWTGADVHSGDWKPTILVGGLMMGFGIIMAVPGLRAVFALSPLSGLEIGIAVVATVIWLFVVRFLWRRRVIERFLGLKFA